MTDEEVTKAIEAIPGPAGWWKGGGQGAYVALWADLKAHGYTDEEAMEHLSEAFWNAAAEYGA